MISYLLTSSINEVYENSFRIAETSSEIILGSTCKFICENTLLLADIYLTGSAIVSMCELYNDYFGKNNTRSTTIPYKPPIRVGLPIQVGSLDTQPKNKIYEKIMLLFRTMGVGIVTLVIFFMCYPLFLTIPVVSIRIINNIFNNKLHILKLGSDSRMIGSGVSETFLMGLLYGTATLRRLL